MSQVIEVEDLMRSVQGKLQAERRKVEEEVEDKLSDERSKAAAATQQQRRAAAAEVEAARGAALEQTAAAAAAWAAEKAALGEAAEAKDRLAEELQREVASLRSYKQNMAEGAGERLAADVSCRWKMDELMD